MSHSGSMTGNLQACESLIEEHRQMEILLDALGAALEQDGAEELLRSVRVLMQRILLDLNTHFACEEEALFPVVSPYHPMVLMEEEHEMLIALRSGIFRILDEENPSAAELLNLRELVGEFINQMLDHISREDHGIFPACEQALSDFEKQSVIERMNQIRLEAEVRPTPTIQREEKSVEVLPVDVQSEPQRVLFSKKLIEQAGVEVKQLTIRAGEFLASHWSPRAILLIMLNGEGELMASGQRIPLASGSCLRMSARLTHAIAAKTDCYLLLVLLPQDSSVPPPVLSKDAPA